MQYAVVEYYNVKFYIIFKRDEDISKFWYLSNRIEAGEKLYIEDYQLLQALITLSEEQKKVILLRIFYEKTFREIDWILGFPEKKAENTYYNAIKKLRKLMGGKRHGV